MSKPLASNEKVGKGVDSWITDIIAQAMRA